MAGADIYIDERAVIGGTPHSMLAFEEAAALLDLEPWIVQRLRHPIDECTAHLQITRDSGEPVCVPFFSIHHNQVSGCSAGSLALAPGLQLRDCQAVGRERAWQSALLGLPLGGVSYGIVCDPESWSERELTALVRPVARQLQRSGDSHIVFPGRGCHREFLGRLSAELSDSHSVVVTGKPGCMGGLDHPAFAAEGIVAAISHALQYAGRPTIGARVAIQGFAGLGQALSQRLVREGMKVVALSDNSGGVYRADGLIMSDVNHRLAQEQVLFDYTEAEHVSRVELLHADADVLVLTWGSSELNATNCRNVAAGLVVEADYNAVDEAAKDFLESNHTSMLPWFLATCGTLLASYWEAHQLQILSPPEELLARSYSMVGQAVEGVMKHGSEQDCPVDQAAYRLAVEAAANYLRACGQQH